MSDIVERLREKMGLMSEVEVWETCEEAADEIERLQADLREAREMVKRADANCEFWAQESKSGGWSTHQVEPNKKLASEMRALLAK